MLPDFKLSNNQGSTDHTSRLSPILEGPWVKVTRPRNSTFESGIVSHHLKAVESYCKAEFLAKMVSKKSDKKLTKCRQIEDKIRIWSFYFKIKINPSHKTKSMILTQLLTLIKTLHFELPSDDAIGVAILCCL